MNRAAMKLKLATIVCIGFLLEWSGFAQVASTPPQHWKRETPLNIGMGFYRVDLSYNSPEAIQQEILDTDTVRLIAKSGGLSDEDLATVQIAQEPRFNWVGLYQLGNSEKAYNILSEQLRNYVRAREDGHTRAYVMAAITNRTEASMISDPGLRAIAEKQHLLPLSWLKLAESGTITNKAGQTAGKISMTTVNGKTVTNETTHILEADEVCRWVKYTLVDGTIAWQYHVQFKSDGSLYYVMEIKCDAKDCDPKYKKLMTDVENEVRGEMKRDGTSGHFGSVHTFWDLKQNKLRARGIEWRSPRELNPNSIFD